VSEGLCLVGICGAALDAHFLRLSPFPPVATGGSGWCRRMWGRSGWLEARRPWVALFPPTVATSSGWNRRVWLEWEGFVSGREESRAPGAHLLRLLLLPPAAAGGSDWCRRMWVGRGGRRPGRPWVALLPPAVATPPVGTGGSGWCRRMWVGRGGPRLSDPGLRYFLRLLLLPPAAAGRVWLEWEDVGRSG
jgi:hypothetical protein